MEVKVFFDGSKNPADVVKFKNLWQLEKSLIWLPFVLSLRLLTA